tara:strand:+ start:1187 stop:1873 length:687 start_codon:yes stop_codon:yes gene_type:complete
MIFRFKKKIWYSINLIRDGKLKEVWQALTRRLYSEELAFGFKRDLSIKIHKPRSLAKVIIREGTSEDEKYFSEDSNDGRIKNFQTCYVAINYDKIPCFRTWLIDASQNEKLKKAWGNNFPQLKKDEILLEKVFTIPKYRGMGILPIALYEISEKGLKLGAKYAICFGAVMNKNTSCSFCFAGFEPYILRKVRWFLFIKFTSYQEIPVNLLTDYKIYTQRYLPIKMENH